MNRVIKFRAWDKIYKLMDICPSWDKFDSFLIKDCLSGDNRFSIMQFTGLNDKNGKDIYEGDILQSPHKKITIVAFHEGCFCAKLGTDFLSILGGGFCINKQVIGNIYENPELWEAR